MFSRMWVHLVYLLSFSALTCDTCPSILFRKWAHLFLTFFCYPEFSLPLCLPVGEWLLLTHFHFLSLTCSLVLPRKWVKLICSLLFTVLNLSPSCALKSVSVPHLLACYNLWTFTLFSLWVILALLLSFCALTCPLHMLVCKCPLLAHRILMF